MSIPFLLRLSCLAVLAASLLPAGVITVTNGTVSGDLSNWLAVTSASATTPLPLVGPRETNPRTVGSLTFSLGPGTPGYDFGSAGSGWSTLIAGNEIGFDALEELNVDIDSPVYSFGFQFHEPSVAGFGDTDVCNTLSCTDGTFTVTLKNGGATVGSFQFNAADDTAAFIGVFSDTLFNRVEIRETSGGFDNEFYGQFYTGDTAPSEVPEPSSLMLLSGGVSALLFIRRVLQK